MGTQERLENMEAEVNSEAGKLIGFILDSGSMQLQAYVSYTNILSLSKRDRRDEVGQPRIRINKLGGTVHYARVNNAIPLQPKTQATRKRAPAFRESYTA